MKVGIVVGRFQVKKLGGDLLQTVFEDGKILINTSLADIRNRAKV